MIMTALYMYMTASSRLISGYWLYLYLQWYSRRPNSRWSRTRAALCTQRLFTTACRRCWRIGSAHGATGLACPHQRAACAPVSIDACHDQGTAASSLPTHRTYMHTIAITTSCRVRSRAISAVTATGQSKLWIAAMHACA